MFCKALVSCIAPLLPELVEPSNGKFLVNSLFPLRMCRSIALGEVTHILLHSVVLLYALALWHVVSASIHRLDSDK